MSYVIQVAPGRIEIVAEIGTVADLAALQRAIAAVAPLIEQDRDSFEEITRQPKQAKALRAAKAEKAIRPEPQAPAIPQPDADREDDARDLRTAGGKRFGVPNSVSADRDAKLREMWARDDLTVKQIADALDLHFTTVSQRAKLLGLPSRKGKGRVAALPSATRSRNGSFDRTRAASITAALMGDPGYGASVGVQRAGPQHQGGEPI